MDFESSVQTISWLRDRYREGSLQLKPPFQRKPVWTANQKCYLIESILMGLPIPEIYVQQVTSSEGDTVYAVVDGQQRVRTVLQFVGADEDPDEQEFNKFALDKLEADSEWRNLTFSELSEEAKKRFYGYRFSLRYLNTDSDDQVRDMFKRLNKFLTPLNAQELRNATYQGPFIKLVYRLADNEYWTENRFFTPAPIRRQKDAEYVSELLIGVLHGPQGGSAKLVDEYYERHEDYEDEFPDQKRAKKLFDETLAAIRIILPDIKESRWSNKADFYTLFVAMASLLRSKELPMDNILEIKKALIRLADEVDLRLSDEEAKVDKNVADYVRAVEKGVNDKRRRAGRQVALLNSIGSYFEEEPRTSDSTQTGIA